MFMSSAVLRDAMGRDYFYLLDGLGITARDGEITLDGETVGNLASVERDFVGWIADSGDWMWADGVAASWTGGTHWRLRPKEALQSAVFDVAGRCTLTMHGDQRPFPTTAKLAKAVADMVMGRLSMLEPPESIDDMLPLSNGVLDLSTGVLSEHGRAYGNRWILPFKYDADARCPALLDYLATVAPLEADFLQEWTGYCLRVGNPFQRLLWVYGPGGTGKSTFLNIIMGLLEPDGGEIEIDGKPIHFSGPGDALAAGS